MSMSTTRLWVLGTAVLSVLLMLAAYFLLIGPKRAEAADLRQQTVDTQTSNAMLQTRIEQLKVQFAELPQRQAELAAIKQAFPEEAAMPNLVRDLDQMAAAAGVTLMSLAPGEPAPVVDPAAAATAAAATITSPGASPSGDLLLGIPTTIAVVGDFHESELFLKNLQTEMPRALLVQSLSVQAEKAAAAAAGKPATVNGDVTMTITGSVFILKSGDAAGAPTTVAQSVSASSSTSQPPVTTN